jgi:ABC-type uncharacterized transport system auxiliary subunit
MRFSNRTAFTALTLVLLTLAAGCSSKQFLVVHYQLPEPPDTLEVGDVYLTVSDVRENKAFLSENAQRSLRNFNDTYSLVVQQADGSGNLLGIYEINTLLLQVFNKRLENMGMQVTAPADQAEYELEIKLKEFKLDLVGQKWIINMNYQADLAKNRDLRAMETVSGSAERLKVISESDAEKVLGELLTDMVNKLDLAKLFQLARR